MKNKKSIRKYWKKNTKSYRTRKREAGMVRYEKWIYEKHRTLIDKFINDMNETGEKYDE